MFKSKISLFIPLLLITGLLVYTWITIFLNGFVPTWRHYLAILLFAPLIYLFIKNFRKALLATILYLIIGTCNLLTLTASILRDSYGVRIGSIEIETPTFQRSSFGLLALVCVLNFKTLIDIYLDFKENRRTKIKESLETSNESVTITGGNFRKIIAWNEITQLNVFKKDFLTWDRIELEIIYGDKILTINEDVEGWQSFVTKINEAFPTLPVNWDTEVVHPPFETNFRTIYSKV